MGAMKQHQLKELDREYDEKAHAAQERDDDVGYKDRDDKQTDNKKEDSK